MSNGIKPEFYSHPDRPFWLVASGSRSGVRYKVEVDPLHCHCEAKAVCKHIIAVAAEIGINIPPDNKGKKPSIAVMSREIKKTLPGNNKQRAYKRPRTHDNSPTGLKGLAALAGDQGGCPLPEHHVGSCTKGSKPSANLPSPSSPSNNVAAAPVVAGASAVTPSQLPDIPPGISSQPNKRRPCAQSLAFETPPSRKRKRKTPSASLQMKKQRRQERAVQSAVPCPPQQEASISPVVASGPDLSAVLEVSPVISPDAGRRVRSPDHIDLRLSVSYLSPPVLSPQF